jgi:hypothetical protein
MSVSQLVLEFVKVLIWPVTLILLLFVYRDAILTLLPKSKIKITLFGLEVETSLPELETITLSMLGGQMDQRQLHLLTTLVNDGPVSYDKAGVPGEERNWIRPLMNAGLIMTLPAGEHLGKAEGLALTPLGTLLMRPKLQSHPKSSR